MSDLELVAGIAMLVLAGATIVGMVIYAVGFVGALGTFALAGVLSFLIIGGLSIVLRA